MACPVGLLQFQFSGLIARFVKTSPAVAVHLKSVNRAVDVIAEGFDLAIRVRFPPLDDTGLVMRKLDDSRQCLVASPGLISSPVTSPVDLSRFPSLDLGPVRTDSLWGMENAGGPDRKGGVWGKRG